MTNKEAIHIIETAITEVEWEYPMNYAAAFDKAIEALKTNNKAWQILVDIYQFAYKTFFGTDREEVLFRVNQGHNGAERKVLEYIKNKTKDI